MQLSYICNLLFGLLFVGGFGVGFFRMTQGGKLQLLSDPQNISDGK